MSEATETTVPETYEDASNTLADWHYEADPELEAVYLFPDTEQQTVRFLEVSPVTPATGSVMAFEFGRVPEFPYRSIVAVITPEEWQRVERGEMSLPAGWELPQARRITRRLTKQRR